MDTTLRLTTPPRDVAALLPHLLAARQPVLLLGAPGVGKSSLVRQAVPNGQKLWDWRAVLLEPVDLRGIPARSSCGKLCEWLQPAFLPRPGEAGVLFLDELPQASTAVQSALLQLCLDRRIGDYELPDGVAIAAAGNRVADRTGASRLISALADRFVQLEMHADFDDWTMYVRDTIDANVISFLRWKPSYFAPEANHAALANPSPRAWSKVSTLLPTLLTSVSRQAARSALHGIVGAVATELLAFVDARSQLPSAAAMLAAPESIPLPAKLDHVWALAGSLVEHFRDPSHCDKAALIPVFKLLLRLPDDVAVVTAMDVNLATKLGRLMPAAMLTPEGKTFADKFRPYFMATI